MRLVTARDMEGAHEMLHVGLVGTPGLLVFLFGEPDVFLGNVGKHVERRNFAGSVNCYLEFLASFHASVAASPQPFWSVFLLRDKPDYHVGRRPATGLGDQARIIP